jgi:small subunit ribosomal protein S16
MAVSIRLRREGAKNRPYYKVVVADSRSPRDGKFIELIGTYDPKKPDHNSTLKLDRIDHWIALGAQPSDTVRSLIKKNKAQPASAASDAVEPTAAQEEPATAADEAAPTAVAEEPAPTAVAEETAPTAVAEEAAPTAVTEEAAPTAVAEEAAPAESPATPPPQAE